MKIRKGDIVTLAQSRDSVPIRMDDAMSARQGTFVNGEIALVIDPGGSSCLEVKLVTSSGHIGWVVGAWLNVLAIEK